MKNDEKCNLNGSCSKSCYMPNIWVFFAKIIWGLCIGFGIYMMFGNTIVPLWLDESIFNFYQLITLTLFGLSFGFLIDRINIYGLCGGDSGKRPLIFLYVINIILHISLLKVTNPVLFPLIILYILVFTWFKIFASWVDGYKKSSILLIPYGVWLYYKTYNTKYEYPEVMYVRSENMKDLMQEEDIIKLRFYDGDYID